MKKWWQGVGSFDRFTYKWYAIGIVYAVIGVFAREDWLLALGAVAVVLSSMLISFQKAVWDDHKEKEDRRVQESQASGG